MTWGMSGDVICSNMIYMFSPFKVWTGKQCHAYIPCQLSTHAMQKKEVSYATRMWLTPLRPYPIILWRWGPWQRSYLWMDWKCMGWSDGLEFQMERNITGQDLSWWASIFFSLNTEHVAIMLCFVQTNKKNLSNPFRTPKRRLVRMGRLVQNGISPVKETKPCLCHWPTANQTVDFCSFRMRMRNHLNLLQVRPFNPLLETVWMLKNFFFFFTFKKKVLFFPLSHTPGRFGWRCSPCCRARCFVSSGGQNEGNPRSLQLLLSRCHSL